MIENVENGVLEPEEKVEELDHSVKASDPLKK